MIALEKPIRRKTRGDFLHYKTPVVVELKPGDYIGLRLLRHKREVVLSLHDLYFEGVRRQVAAEKRAKKKTSTTFTK
jgi:hypothetical protein